MSAVPTIEGEYAEASLAKHALPYPNPTSVEVGEMEITNMTTEELRKTVERLILSYESQVSTIGAIVDGAHGIVQTVKKDRAEVNKRLRESLARDASLRKKDFDTMMMGFNLYQEKREEEIRRKIDAFLNQQRELPSQLKALLEGVDVDRVGNTRTTISNIQCRQAEAAREISEAIRSFQKEHEQLVGEAGKIVTSTASLGLADFRSWLSQGQPYKVVGG